MAIIYLRNSAAGVADGTSWTDAYTDIQTALTAWTTSDIIWMASDHTQTTGSALSLSCGNVTANDHCVIYRVDHTTDLYDPTTQDDLDTAQIILTGSVTTFTINFSSAWHGIKFDLAYTCTQGAADSIYFEDCEINFGTVSNNAKLAFNKNALLHAKNTTFRNDDTTTSTITASSIAYMLFEGCIFDIVTDATGFIQAGAISSTQIEFRDCDLTALSNNILVDTSDFGTSDEMNIVNFINCKLKSTYEMGDGTFNGTNSEIVLSGCSANAATTYINRALTFKGEIDTSVSVYRDAGYQAYDGDTPLSIVMTPTADCKHHQSIKTSKVSGVVESTGSKTFTVEVVENFTTALTAQDMWLELFYYDSATNTHHAIDTSTREFAKATYTALSAGAGLGGWTAEPAGSRSVKISTTVTVNKVGYYYGVVHLGNYEAGKVAHVDPLMSVA